MLALRLSKLHAWCLNDFSISPEKFHAFRTVLKLLIFFHVENPVESAGGFYRIDVTIDP